MNILNDIIKGINNVPVAAKNNSPFLFMVAGVVGIGATVVSAIQATPLAIDAMDEKLCDRVDAGELDYTEVPVTTNKEDMRYRFELLGPKEVIKSCWKCYAPTAILGGLTIASFISSYKISSYRLTTLATAYEFTRNSYENYRRRVSEELNSKQKERIRKKEIKEETDKKVTDNDIFGLPEGKEVCLDLWTGSVFYSTREDILKAVGNIKDKFLSGEMDVSVNEFYDEIGAPHIGAGDEMGFTPDTNIEVSFDSVLRGNKPVLTISYLAAPRFDYRKLM